MTANIDYENSAQVGDILALFYKNLTVRAIARELRLSETLVHETLTEHYGPKPATRRNAEVKLQVIEMYADNASIAEICEALNLHERRVHRYLRGNRPEHRPAPKQTHVSKELDTRIREMLADGAPATEVADTVGLNPSQIHQRYPGLGWKPSESASFKRWLMNNPSARELLHWTSK